MTAACDLADDLRDAVVEYQVSISIEEFTQDRSLIFRLIVRAAGDNLRAEL